jgi:hypothetical protein
LAEAIDPLNWRLYWRRRHRVDESFVNRVPLSAGHTLRTISQESSRVHGVAYARPLCNLPLQPSTDIAAVICSTLPMRQNLWRKPTVTIACELFPESMSQDPITA